MNMRNFAFQLALIPCLALAQGPANQTATDRPNKETRAVLLANYPKDMPEADWLRMMEQPVNQSLYPLRLTQAMLDTIDAEKLDLRFRYVVMRVRGVQVGPTPR
jgi:hypothetical protein